MDLSGIIFVVLAVAWAVYLIPKALKHHDEVARTRSIDRFSTAMRVLSRRDRGSAGDAGVAPAPARAADTPRVVVPTARRRSVPAPTRAQRAAARKAARLAARRRRRILGLFLLATGVVAGLAGFAVVPWWSVSIPGGLVVAWLVICRVQVRRLERARFEAELETLSDEVHRSDDEPLQAPGAAARVDASYDAVLPTVRNAQGFDELDPNEDTVGIKVPVLEAAAVPTADGGTLWDPLPVTLPTYVTKPKARRTVRTIDLGEPGTWTSGRTSEDAELAASATEPAAADTVLEEPRRAVGS